MLTIRREQMQVLGGGFAPRLMDYLREHDAKAAAGFDDEGLLRLIDTGLGGAHAIGLTSEHDCARWIEILLVHGLDFGRNERTTWAAEILREPGLEAGARLAMIDAWLAAEEAWQRRRAQGDKHA